MTQVDQLVQVVQVEQVIMGVGMGETKLVSGYRKLVVWQEAKALTLLVYELSSGFPKSEEYGLKSQMRRASVSTMSNIAEGWLRRSTRDKLRYLEIAEGTNLELESEGEVAYGLKYWSDGDYDKFDKQRARVSYLLYRYKGKIETS